HVNSMVTPAFYRLSPEVSAQLPLLRSEGRTFTCDPHSSLALSAALSQMAAVRRPTDPWSYGVLVQTLYPDTNAEAAVPAAYGIDSTRLYSPSRVFRPEEADCRPFTEIVDRLRRAGVAHVISVDPLEDPGLTLRAEIRPSSIDPLAIRVYT